MSSVTVDSDQLIIGAEAGQIVGLFVHLDDGRRLFIPGANVTGIVDAPKDSGKKRKA
jgi:hypothetical protein